MSVRPWTPAHAVTLVLAAAVGSATGAQAQLRAVGPHRDLVCVACHDGVLSDRSLPHVSPGTCEECHDVRGLLTGALHFDHGQHQGAAGPETGCASCHTHARGTDELGPGLDTCALCHRADVEGDGMALRMYVDPETHYIVRSESVFLDAPAPLGFATDYSDFRRVGGVVFPFREETFASGVHTASTVLGSVELNPTGARALLPVSR